MLNEQLVQQLKNEALDNAFVEITEQLNKLKNDIDFLASEIRDIRSILREHNIFHKPPKDALVY